MPGVRPRGFWMGDSAELFAQFMLGRLAFTTAVARQDDVGIDFLCTLVGAGSDAKMLRPGPFFTVQVKNKREPIEYRKQHEIDWIWHQENPFFICVSDLGTHAIELYSTWQLQKGTLIRRGDDPRPPVVLVPSGEEYEYHEPAMSPSGELRIPLGKPVVQMSIEEANDDYEVNGRRSILQEWVRIGRNNIVSAEAGICWIVGPTHYDTNQLPGEEVSVHLIWSTGDLATCLRNFGRSATVVRLIMEGTQSTMADRLDKLEEVLRVFSFFLEEPSKEALRDELGIEVGEGSPLMLPASWLPALQPEAPDLKESRDGENS